MFEKGTVIWKNSIGIMHERLESSKISANKHFNSLLVRWKEFEKSTRGGIDDVTVLLNQLYFIHVANYLYSIKNLQSAGRDVTPATISNDFAGNLFELCRGGEPFKIFSELSEFLWDDGTEESRSIMNCFVEETTIQATMKRMNQGGDMLSLTYQTLFSSNKKHSTGEFYTPMDLCNMMVEKLASRLPGAVVLDPSCGVGTFLVSWIEHALHDKNIQDPVAGTEFRMHGWDINPVAIIGARVNTWLGFPEGIVQFGDIVQNIKLKNALEDSEESASLKADVIIGNPPWVTLKDY
ncbi:N-6 DNA methylase, partial [Candidatus Bathyarchaeota archaeon]|nr:N-6 DNA methylase [Candidatus Bathyarchaeota archaeon]